MKEYTVKVCDERTVWYLNGKKHREDGPAVEYANGDKYWYLNGKCHREDGPAIENANGDKYWYLNGKLHREDGPAVERSNGDKSWFLNGKFLSEEEFKAKNQPVELTMDQIAEKFGIPVEQLKIVKPR